MNFARLIGLIGSLIGTAIPLATVQISSPLLGWHALGGAEPYSFFWMRPLRHPPGHGYFRPLLIAEHRCPGEVSFRQLKTAPFPRSGAGLPYDGLVACVLAAPNGRVVRVRIMDAQGQKVEEPKLESFIASNWRFEVKSYRETAAWQRIRLDGLLAREGVFAL